MTSAERTESMELDASAMSCTVSRLDEAAWSQVLDKFDDANIFQSTAFAAARFSSQRVEHVVVQRAGDTIAAALVRLIRLPLTGTSFGYVLWGPMYRRKHVAASPVDFQTALRALRQEYVERRGIGLRLRPAIPNDASRELMMLGAEGFAPAGESRNSRTILVDLTPSIEELRKGLDKKWRNCLSSAERNGLHLVEGTDDSLFDLFQPVYRQMLDRKGLAETSDFAGFRAMQALLPAEQKMVVIVALENGEPCAGGVFSALGTRGVYHLGGTADRGTKNKGSYLVQWRAVAWLKERGCTEYDLHGINPELNPGVYAFKSGLCGRNGREVEWVGSFESHANRRAEMILHTATRANEYYKKLKGRYGHYRGITE